MQSGKIAPSRARAWFENKRFIGPDQTLLFISQSWSRIAMCNLHCITLFALVFLVLHIFTLVLHILHSFLSQSELSNFFVYIINVVTGRFCSTAPAQREQRVEVGPPNLTGSFAHAQYVWPRCCLLGALRDALRFSQVHAVHSEACLHYRLSDQRYQKTGDNAQSQGG